MKNLFLYQYYIAIFTLALVVPIAASEVKAQSFPIITQQEHYPAQLLERAKQLYQNEQYLEASKIWQQAVEVFRHQGDVLNQAMALSNLALTQQKLGELTAADRAIASSLELLKTQPVSESQQRILANSLDIQGSIKRSQGKSKIAFEIWQRSEDIYRQWGNQKAVIKTQINQAQALQDLGYYRRATHLLQSVQTLLINEPDSPQKVNTLLNFGDTLRATGNIEQSQVVLQEALGIAEKLNMDRSAIFLSYGNTILALGNRANESQTTGAVSNSSDSQGISENFFDTEFRPPSPPNLGGQNLGRKKRLFGKSNPSLFSPTPLKKGGSLSLIHI